MSFDVEVGHASQRGPRERLEDFAAVARPAPQEDVWGLIAAIADGVSAGGHGLEAAQSSVLGLMRDYYATPAIWDTTVALDRVISAQNAWLVDHNRRRQSVPSDMGGGAGMTTLTALVLRGHGFVLAHVGDSRAYLIRDGVCTQLTQDHTLGALPFQSGLTRALGLDDGVRVDYIEGEVRIGDVFVLSTDGVHRHVRDEQWLSLADAISVQEASEHLVGHALSHGGHDNATVLAMRIKGLEAARLEDAERRGRSLPIPPRMKEGDAIDGLRVEALVFSNEVHRVYRVRNERTAQVLALKTLNEGRANDPEERAMLAHEAWLGARVTERDAKGLIKVVEPAEPSAFYALFEWQDGTSLGQLLASQRRFAVPEVVQGALAVARALGRLHQHGVIHRDVKPDNVHLGSDGQWRIMDLGVALSGKEPDALRQLHAGTPSYMNPEQWGSESDAAQADAQSDLYALGVTLYQWLTGRLPFGDIEPYQVGRYRRDPLAPSRLRPDVPIWLDHIVLKAIARDRKQRFETAEELVLALERGASRPLVAPSSTPLMSRDPLTLWQVAFAVSLLVNLLLVYWLIFLPRN